MKVALEVGAELDLVSPHELNEALKKQTIELHTRENVKQPQSQRLLGSGVWVSSSLLIVPRPQGPPSGHQWHVRNWSCSTRAAKTTSAAVIDLYSGPRETIDVTEADFGQMWRDSSRGNPLPFGNTWDDWQWVMQHGEAVWAVISGGTAAEAYTLTVWVKEEPAPREGAVAWEL